MQEAISKITYIKAVAAVGQMVKMTLFWTVMLFLIVGSLVSRGFNTLLPYEHRNIEE